jgi:hypothetical protein
MKYSASEKLEIIRLVEESALPVRRRSCLRLGPSCPVCRRSAATIGKEE